MSTIVSRIGYCPECAKNGSPKTNQIFIVVGSCHCVIKVLRAKHNGKLGFTPHFYKFQKQIDNKVFYQEACGVCGIYSFVKNGEKYYTIDRKKWSGWKKTTLTNWQALNKRWKNTGFEI